MSENRHGKKKGGPGRAERYIQPSILMAVAQRETYGYELIGSIQDFGFFKGQAPPGMIYRHLRQMEEEGLVESKWETQDAGPAKRTYSATVDGLEVLEAWIAYMQGQADALSNFVQQYHEMVDEQG